jgi:hypothetical protein
VLDEGSHVVCLSQQKKNNRFRVLCSYRVPPFQLAQHKQENPTFRLYWMWDWCFMQVKSTKNQFVTNR